MLITIDINSCKECPYIEVGERRTTDGFDEGCDWTCSKAKRQIAEFVDWRLWSLPEIPDWCPCKTLGL